MIDLSRADGDYVALRKQKLIDSNQGWPSTYLDARYVPINAALILISEELEIHLTRVEISRDKITLVCEEYLDAEKLGRLISAQILNLGETYSFSGLDQSNEMYNDWGTDRARSWIEFYFKAD